MWSVSGFNDVAKACLVKYVLNNRAVFTTVARGNPNWRSLGELRLEFFEPPRSIEIAVRGTACYYVLSRDAFLLAIPTRS